MTERRVDVRSRSSSSSPPGVTPRLSARSDASWIVPPSSMGSENGRPISIASGARLGVRAAWSTIGGHAAGDVGHQQGPSGVTPPTQVCFKDGGHMSLASWSASLSPRPDRFTSTVDPRQLGGPGRPDHPGHGVGRLQGGDDPLVRASSETAPRGPRRRSRSRRGAARVRQMGVLGPDARIVEAGRDRVGLHDWPASSWSTRTGSRAAPRACRRPMAAPPRARRPPAARRCRRSRRSAGGVRAAAHAGHHDVGHAAVSSVRALAPGLLADDPLELADHPRVGVRAHDRADAVVGVVHRRPPSPGSPR